MLDLVLVGLLVLVAAIVVIIYFTMLCFIYLIGIVCDMIVSIFKREE
jgi:hypothetical protein